jgi:hypothetical protein
VAWFRHRVIVKGVKISAARESTGKGSARKGPETNRSTWTLSLPLLQTIRVSKYKRSQQIRKVFLASSLQAQVEKAKRAR